MAGEDENMEAEPEPKEAEGTKVEVVDEANGGGGGGGAEDEHAGDEGNQGGDGVGGGGGEYNQGGGGKQHRGRQGGRYQRRYQPYGRGGGGGGGYGARAVYHQQEHDGSDRTRRVYVGNLSWETTWRELKDHMKTTGCEVTRADVLCSPDGRSKGCGIIEFETAEGAQRAVLTLNDTELMGRQIFVREDREEGSGGGYYTQQTHTGGGGTGAGGTGGGGGRYASGGDAQTRRVYVGNLSWDVAWQDLKDHMRNAGEVVFAEVMKEHDGRSKGCGIVEFATAAEAEEAISTLTDTELKGRMIFVREDRETTSGGGGGGGGGAVFGGFQGRGGGGGTSVYVGNLAYETSWQDLKDHMRKAGNVDQANILQGEDGRSKGCGIVRYQRPQEASRAIRELQNTMLTGRPIFVREDREQGSHHHGGGVGVGGGGGGGHSRVAAGCQLWVGNLSWDTSWRELKDHFRQCGDVERAEVMEGPDGQSRGFGTVRFYRQRDAANAIQRLNGVELQGRVLEVKIDGKA
uniref:RRM domain-containing protein n=1 Tax=Odontella aurita TaxID=265563 RepID=A0A7S4IV91_9STRA